MRGQVHVGNGAGNQFTGDPKPLLARCRPWPVVEAIKDGAFRTDAVEDVCHEDLENKLFILKIFQTNKTSCPPKNPSAEVDVFLNQCQHSGHQQSHGEQSLSMLNLPIIDLVASSNDSPTPMTGSIAVPSYHSLKEVM